MILRVAGYLLGLAFFTGLATSLYAQNLLAPGANVDRRPEPQAGFWPREVSGIGQTEDSARKHAIESLATKATAFLNVQSPPMTNWAPDFQYARDRLITGTARVVDVEHAGEKFKEVTLDVRELDSVWKDMVRQNQIQLRHQTVVQRQIRTAQIVGAALGILAIGLVLLRVGNAWSFTMKREKKPHLQETTPAF